MFPNWLHPVRLPLRMPSFRCHTRFNTFFSVKEQLPPKVVFLENILCPIKDERVYMTFQGYERASAHAYSTRPRVPS